MSHSEILLKNVHGQRQGVLFGAVCSTAQKKGSDNLIEGIMHTAVYKT
jgi:hypothetical protein